MQRVQRCNSTLPRASRPRAAGVPRPATRSLHVPRTAGTRPQRLVCHTAAADVAAPVQSDNPIALTEKALDHLVKLRADVGGEQLLLRVGVKQGGCSGLSYHMDFEKDENVNEDDTIMEYDSGKFRIVCDPKSLLYLFGMHMDYSDALIGGGFKFSNPNATDNCGCGKSFGV